MMQLNDFFSCWRRISLLCTAAILATCAAPLTEAQSPLSYSGGNEVQNFNTLPASGTFTFPASGPYDLTAAPISASGAGGWGFARVGGTGSVALFFPGTGSSTTGGVFSFGTAAGDRALGMLQSGTNVAAMGAVLVNNTGATLTQFTLSYTGEQWRKGGSTAQDRLIFEYSVGGASLISGTFTAKPELDFLGPIFNAGAGALDGNAAANRTAVSGTVTGIAWAPGQLLVLRWSDFNVTGSDDGLAIDDVTFSALGANQGNGPSVLSTVPSSAATGIDVSAPVSITFNRAVTTSGTWFTLVGSISGAHAATVTGGPTTFQLAPTTPFAGGESVTLAVLASQVVDQATGLIHPPANFSTSFITTLNATPRAIHEVQGSGLTSPYATQAVIVQGIVVASFQGAGKIGGYYIEAPDADQDADPGTSEGIYIFDNTNSVTVGDYVTVTGTVVEFGTAPATTTEISPVSAFTKNSAGNPLPTSVTVMLPFAAANFAERYEGMLVTLPQTLTVTDSFDYGHFGELILSSGRLSTPTNIVAPGVAAQAQAAANRLNQILLDDGLSTTYPNPTPFLTSSDPVTATRRTGSTTTGLTGILDHKFGTYVIEPTGTPIFADANPRTSPPKPAGSLHVAIGNVLNFFNGNGAGGGFPTSRGADTLVEYQRQRAKIIAGILALSPDIMGLTEVENDGFGPTSAIQDVVNGLNAAAPAGTTYAFVDIGLPAVGTDLITCAFIYKTNTVALVGNPAVNLSSVFNRPPLAQTFREIATGEKLTVTINHFKSKGSGPSSGPESDQGDGQAAWNPTRVAQANALTAWLATNPTGDADPDVLIIGDLNSYAKEDPITAVKNAGYINLTETFEGAGGYSYAFDAEFGHLDHALGSPSLASQTTGAESWHVNADEPVYYDYNVENKTAAQQAINAGTPYRYSDHDPVVIGLNLVPATRAPQSYAAWAAARGLTAQNNAAAADPDGDGVANQIEFIIGLNPLVPDSQALPAGIVNGAQFIFRFQHDKSSAGQFVVQSSSDLVTWAPLATSVESSTSATETLVASVTLSEPKQFLRLTSEGVSTFPVGYFKKSIPAAPVTVAFGLPLDDTDARAIGLRAGRIESLTATALTNSSGGWTSNLADPAAPWAVRLTSGVAEGKLFDIGSNNSTTLTLSGGSLTALGVAVGDSFELVALDTLGSLFGANTLQGGTSSSNADVVQVRSGAAWIPFYYDSSLGFWRRTSGVVTNSDNVVIRPGSGVMITRRGGPLTLTFTGRVLGTPFRVPVNNASSTGVTTGFPTDTTLGEFAVQNLIAGWRAGSTTGAADSVGLYNGASWVPYVFNGGHWQTTTGVISDAVILPAGGMLLIQRPGSAAGTTDLIRARAY